MSVLQKLKSALPVDTEDGVTHRTYECQECGNVFESAKQQRRVECPECLAADIQQRE